MIIESLLDCDDYKFRMLNWIFKHYKDVDVEFSFMNRTKSIQIGTEIDCDRLIDELKHLTTLNFDYYDIHWLREQGFEEDFLMFLLREWKFSNFSLVRNSLTNPGQIELTFQGKWINTTMWEIYALAIISELRTENDLGKLTDYQEELLYSEARYKLDQNLKSIKDIPNLKFGDFGTRRRHSKAWQDYVVNSCVQVLGDKFIGTSNCFLAMKYDIPVLGTMAHEIPSTMAALTTDDEELYWSQYDYLKSWSELYPNKKTLLPDTFTTEQFFENCPFDYTSWAYREDSLSPEDATNMADKYFPKGTNLILSDGLSFESILEHHKGLGLYEHAPHNYFYMMGTQLTNGFSKLENANGLFKQASLVIKVSKVNERAAVKISNNINKITSIDKNEIELYKKVFGVDNMNHREVLV